MPLENLDDLQAEWAIFMEEKVDAAGNPLGRNKQSQDWRWRQDNPGEFNALLAYRNGTGPRPNLATVTGRRMVEHVDAYLEAIAEPPPPPPPTSTETLDVYRHTVYPGPYIAPYPGGETHAWHWLTYKQPTLETFPAGSANQADMSTIRWINKTLMPDGSVNRTPDGLYKDRECWIVASMRAYKSSPGRCLNLHQHGADRPKGFNHCNTRTPPSSCGISPLAYDWTRGHTYAGGATGLAFSIQPGEDNYVWPTTNTVLPNAEMEDNYGEWIDSVTRIIFGRVDETVKGEIDIWVDGAKRFEKRNANTFWKDEGMVALWQGAYKSWGTTEEIGVEWVPYRVGRSYQEALAQRPVPAGPGWGSRGQDGRNAFAQKIGTRLISDIVLPNL